MAVRKRDPRGRYLSGAGRGCSVEGCQGTHKGRGLCGTHYKRWQKHGDPLVVRVGGRRRGFTGEPNPPEGNINVQERDGYVYVSVWPGHRLFQYATTKRQHHRQGMLHRLLMAEHLGRPLRPGETVHHIDGDKKNNSLENLQLLQGNHASGHARVCLDCGSPNVGVKELGNASV